MCELSAENKTVRVQQRSEDIIRQDTPSEDFFKYYVQPFYTEIILIVIKQYLQRRPNTEIMYELSAENKTVRVQQRKLKLLPYY